MTDYRKVEYYYYLLLNVRATTIGVRAAVWRVLEPEGRMARVRSDACGIIIINITVCVPTIYYMQIGKSIWNIIYKYIYILNNTYNVSFAIIYVDVCVNCK